MFIRIVALSTALALTGGAAFAEGLIQANLQSSLAKPAAPVVGNAEWACQGSTCATQVDPDSNAYVDAYSLSSCEALVKSVGAVSTYSRDGKSFSAAQLTQCNGFAKNAGVQTAAAH